MRLTLLLVLLISAAPFHIEAQSVYSLRPGDPEAEYFTPGNFDIKNDGKQDVSEALQQAIDKLKREKNYGVLFIPEGKYLISKCIYIPKAIRLIGYGKKRPEFILAKNSAGYQDEINYMFWFTSNLVEEGRQPRDASAGTFYSAISNIDFRIEKGNPSAVALRTHFAQHGFVSHCNFHTGDGYAGIEDLGNEVEDLKFYGGEYGISSGRTSPGWPMMLIDIHFEGQRSAAISSRNTGMAIVSMHVKNVPVAVELEQGIADRLFMEECLFENVKNGIIIGVDYEACSQVNLLNINCVNVDVPVHFSPTGKSIKGKGKAYRINSFVHGLVMDDMNTHSEFQTQSDIEALSSVPQRPEKHIPSLPSMDSWVNVRDFGAVGDGKTDDTQAIRAAISSNENIYLPAGWYRITSTLKLNKGTKLIGLHPYATQLVLEESETAFSGFGAPVPVLESSEGGNDMVNGIGISTGAYNYRAVAIKWMAGEKSMINDVKFVGGHGSMPKPGEPEHRRRRNRKISSPAEPIYEQGMDQAWDNQYWSLWVTNNGGGIFKDIWTASTYASCGLYISHTSTPGKIYAMSLEHHVRQEARLHKVANWKFYAFQFEEEGREGKNAQTLNISSCRDLVFANLWMYRTIRVNTPRPWGIKVSDSRNIDFRNMRSWTQVLQLPGRTVFDMDRNLAVYPGDFARAQITGNEKLNRGEMPVMGEKPVKGVADKLGFGYEFATGLVSDSRGNVYFCENQQKRIYIWCADTRTISIYADYPYKPFSLAVDTKDNLIVICRYDPQPGFEAVDAPLIIDKLPDNNPQYSGWGNGGWVTLAYAIAPDHGDEMQVLELRKTSEIENIQKVIHPTHRWRNNFGEAATTLAETSFVAPDGVTLIPNTFDLARSVQLVAVTPNQSQPVYLSHEDPKITYRFRVDEKGKLQKMSEFVRRGEYSNVCDDRGNVYLAEGQIIVFDRDANELKRFTLDERVLSMTLGGKEKTELFVSTATALYKIKL